MTRAAAAVAPAGRRDTVTAACRALVVDDDEATRLLSERALGCAGIETVTASDGGVALDLLHESAFDVVLLDSVMPGMDGREVLARMREDPATRTLPVILVTGETDPSQRVDGLERGADDYVTKPVDFAELAARIRALVRRHAEATRTRGIIEAANDAFLAWDVNGAITEWNAQAEAVFGWTKPEVLGRSVAETIFAPASRGAFERAIERFFATGEPPLFGEWVEMTGRHRDDHDLAIQITIWAVRVGDACGLSAFVRSIAARRELETTLRTSEHVQAMIEAAPDVIILSDDTGLILYASPASRATLGFEPEELVGRQARDLVHPEDRRCLARMRQDAINDGYGTTRPMRVYARDGRVLWMEITGCAVRSPTTGEVTGFQTVGRDITLRKAAEAERDRMIAALGRANHELEEALSREQSMVHRLGELHEMKDQFVATVSHELRTPLTSVVGYLEILLDGDAGDIEPQAVSALDVIDQNARRLLGLVEDLLTVGRIEAGAFAIVTEPVELGDLVARSCEAMLPDARHHGVRLTVDVVDHVGTVMGDAAQLDRLLLNLVCNAIKFTPRQGRVAVRVRADDTDAVIEVQDDGVGIPAEEQQHLFNRFGRARHAIDEAVPGTGLGLTIARSIVEQHDGRISLESEVGIGTTITVVLPTAPPHHPPDDRAARSLVASGAEAPEEGAH